MNLPAVVRFNRISGRAPGLGWPSTFVDADTGEIIPRLVGLTFDFDVRGDAYCRLNLIDPDEVVYLHDPEVMIRGEIKDSSAGPNPCHVCDREITGDAPYFQRCRQSDGMQWYLPVCSDECLERGRQ